ncbi:MAG: DNA translocase FtsK 4TM domain-containing protein, partial [Bacteroidales bacterium]|nr:DNA translocase FtsK 4TM domain-containing protein [Bacteroidales bacterium]
MSKNKRIKPVVEQTNEQELVETTVTTVQEKAKETEEAPSPKQSKNYLYLVGVFLLLSSVLLAVSFVSFFFVGSIDYDVVTSNGDVGEVRNAGGVLFGKIAYYCVYCGFGLATLIFPALLFLVGIQMLGIRKFKWYSLSIKGVVSVFWISTLLGSFFRSGFYGTLFSGSIGIWCSASVEVMLGKTGLFLVLFFVL